MDNAKFINSYIDIMTGTLHEYMASVLQLKTNLKVTQDLADEFRQRILELEQTLSDAITSRDAHINDLQGKFAEVSNRCNELENKSGHIDTFAKTISELKEAIKERDSIISDLQAKSPKPAINKTKDQTSKKPDDDF